MNDHMTEKDHMVQKIGPTLYSTYIMFQAKGKDITQKY